MKTSAIKEYISTHGVDHADSETLGFIAELESVAKTSPEVAASIVRELRDQRSNLKLIASENYSSLTSQLAMGNLLTDKYAEGVPDHRFYAGCDNVDAVEKYAIEEAKKLFGAYHAYVQPHSGADANLIAYWAILSKRIEEPLLEEMDEKNPAKITREQWDKIRSTFAEQKLLGLDYYSGGHLTHGYRFNVSARMFDAYSYGVDEETGVLDYDALQQQVKDIQPLILLTGYSAYPRLINFRKMKEIADSVGAVFMVDMAHFAGLVAGGVMSGDYDPVPFADIVTTTTHKTLRGPRGGMILANEEFADAVDKGCPLVIGGPLPHIIASKGVAFAEANTEEFKRYAERIVENSKALAEACRDEGMSIASGGTDNHLMLLDVTDFGINGRQAESVVRECGITLNRNALPADPNGPWYTSGLRIGTPAITTLGMGTEEMKEIASILKLVLSNTAPKTLTKGKNAGKPSNVKYEIDDTVVQQARKRIGELLANYQVYPQIDLPFLEKHFLPGGE